MLRDFMTPFLQQLTEIAARLPGAAALKVLQIDNRAAIVEGVSSEHPRY